MRSAANGSSTWSRISGERVQRRAPDRRAGVMEVERRAVVDQPELAMPDQHVGVARRAVEVGDEGVEPDDARGELGIGLAGERVEGERAGQVVEAEVECRALARIRSWISGSGSVRARSVSSSTKTISGTGSPSARAISPATSSAISAFVPWPGAAELEDVQAVVVGLDHRRQRAALAQRRDVAGGGDGSHVPGADSEERGPGSLKMGSHAGHHHLAAARRAGRPEPPPTNHEQNRRWTSKPFPSRPRSSRSCTSSPTRSTRTRRSSCAS